MRHSRDSSYSMVTMSQQQTESQVYTCIERFFLVNGCDFAAIRKIVAHTWFCIDAKIVQQLVLDAN